MLSKGKGIQRIAAMVLSIAVLGSGVPVKANTGAGTGGMSGALVEKDHAVQETKNYIITTEKKGDFQELAEEYDASTDEQSEEALEKAKTFTAELSGKEAAELEKDKRVELIEEDFCVQGSRAEKNDRQKKAAEKEEKSAEDTEWNIDILNLANRSGKPADAGIRVAVIDSGIDSNEDIEVTERKNFVPGQEGISPVYEDCTGHGTSVAGIIAAKKNKTGITGVNPNVELYSARVLDKNNQARISQIIAAIDWAIEKEVNILNLSFGTAKDSEALHNAIKRAARHNILIIAAAGNEGKIEYPAAYEETVAVGSIGTDGQVSQGSARGSGLELVAPGEQILSTGMLGGVMAGSGTSLAVPHVTGVASLLWEKDRDADAELIRMVLDAGAKKYGDQDKYGYGLVDYEYALSIYADCKRAYEEKGKTEPEELLEESRLEENETAPEVEDYEDVDYVEGRWTRKKHASLAEGHSGITGDNLKVLKLGAVANDEYIKHMKKHPQWHGYFITESEKPINYVTCYIYLTKLAQAFSKGGSTAAKPSYMSQEEYNGIKKYIDSDGLRDPNNKNKRVKWSAILGKHKVNNKNKMLIVYGMALHVATDTFAHSSYDLNGNRIKHNEDDKTKDADTITVKPNREQCARQIADKVLQHIYKGDPGSVVDFRLSNYNTGKDKNVCFKLKRIARYIKAVNSIYYTRNKAYFDKMDVNSVK